MDRQRSYVLALISIVALLGIGVGTVAGAPAPGTTASESSAATFGRTTVGQMYQLTADRKRVSRFSLSEPGSVTHISAYLDGNGSNKGSSQAARFVIYADGAGNPGALLGSTVSHTIAKGAAGQWVSLALRAPVALAPGSYHLGIHTSEANGRGRYAAVQAAGALKQNDQSFAAGPSNPFGPVKTFDLGMSIYATYTPLSVPSSTAPPVLTGEAIEGVALTASDGAWTGSPTSYAYSWLRCDDAGSACSVVGGATAKTLMLTPSDVGSRLRVTVTATNPFGSAAATSAPTAVVTTSSPPPAPPDPPAPPATPDTFGRSTVGALWPLTPDRKRVSRFSLPDDGSVTRISAYVDGNGPASSGTQPIRFVLYGDQAGAPAALVGATASHTIVKGAPGAWVTLALPAPLPLSAGDYHLGILSGGTGQLGRYAAVSLAAGLKQNDQPFATDPSNPFGPVTTFDLGLSIFAEYIPEAGAPAPPPPPGDTEAPSPPQGLAVSAATQSALTLSWDESSDDVGVAGYRVYRDGSLVTSTQELSYSFSGLACGTTFTLGVEAYDAAGNVSERSSIAAATTACPDTSPPTAPGNLRQTGATESAVSADWDASSDDVGVAGYGIYLGGIRVTTTLWTSITISGLACGASLSLGVDAFDAAGNRSGQTTMIAATLPCPPPPPGIEESFGRSDVAAMYGQTAHRKRVSRFVAPASGDLVALSAYVDGKAGGSGSQQLRLVVYSDSGGAPASLLGETSAGTVAAGSSGAWVRLSLPNPVAITGGTAYHLGIHSGPSTMVARYGVVGLGAGMRQNDNLFSDGATGSFGAVSTFDFGLSLRAHYTTGPPAPPENTSIPTIGGQAQAGNVLSASPGSWSGSPAPTPSYQWSRCDSAGANCSPISGATSTSYTLVSADESRRLRVAVTATNTSGSATALSDPTGLVEATPPPPPPGSGLANLWVHPQSSGSCTRSATPVAYSAAAACSTLAAAYGAANAHSASSTVLVRGGNYSAQPTIAGNRTSSNVIVIAAAPGEVPVMGNRRLDVSDADYITFRGLTLDVIGNAFPNPLNRAGVHTGAGASHIRFENMTVGSFLVTGSEHIAFVGGNYGPCDAGYQPNPPAGFTKHSQPCDNNKLDHGGGNPPRNILIDGIEFAGYNLGDSCYQTGADCHWEIAYFNGVRDVTVRNSIFRDGFMSALFVTISGSDAARTGNRNILIENNFFGTMTTGRPGAYGRPDVINLVWCGNYNGPDGPGHGFRDVTVRFNSFSRGASFFRDDAGPNRPCTHTNIQVYGNIFGVKPECFAGQPGTVFGYNVIRSGTACHPTDVTLGGPAGFSFYANDTHAPGPTDYQLVGPAAAPDNRVPVAVGCPATDRFGNTRGVGGFCDAGAHER
jgi:chitodextrinase